VKIGKPLVFYITDLETTYFFEFVKESLNDKIDQVADN